MCSIQSDVIQEAESLNSQI